MLSGVRNENRVQMSARGIDMKPSADAQRYENFVRHNKIISILRWVVPVVGVVFLSIPVIEYNLRKIIDILPFEGIFLQNDTLVVDAPKFEGVTAAGAAYSMSAESAESYIGNLDVTALRGLVVDIVDGTDYTANVRFKTAQWTMSQELLVSNDDVFVTDSTGVKGVLAGVEVNWPKQIVASDGPVMFSFDNGTQINGRQMVYDLSAAKWTFTKVNVTMAPEADAGEERDPFAGRQ